MALAGVTLRSRAGRVTHSVTQGHALEFMVENFSLEVLIHISSLSYLNFYETDALTHFLDV